MFTLSPIISDLDQKCLFATKYSILLSWKCFKMTMLNSTNVLHSFLLLLIEIKLYIRKIIFIFPFSLLHFEHIGYEINVI